MRFKHINRFWIDIFNFCFDSAGSGAVFTYLATQLQERGVHSMYLATDINPLATTIASQTAKNNGVHTFDLIRTDLAHCFEQRLEVCRYVSLIHAYTSLTLLIWISREQ